MSKTLYFEGAGWSGADSSKATIGNRSIHYPKLPPRCTFAGRICVTRHGGHQAQLLARDHRAA